MKRLILLSTLLLLALGAFAQQETDSTYTTFTTEQVNGFTGNDTCQHEWFVSTNAATDTVNVGGLLWTKTQIVSRQCTKCGKQTTTLNIWKTYEKDTTDDN